MKLRRWHRVYLLRAPLERITRTAFAVDGNWSCPDWKTSCRHLLQLLETDGEDTGSSGWAARHPRTNCFHHSDLFLGDSFQCTALSICTKEAMVPGVIRTKQEVYQNICVVYGYVQRGHRHISKSKPKPPTTLVTPGLILADFTRSEAC